MSSRGVVANILDWNILLRKFKIQVFYLIQIRINTLGKEKKFPGPRTMGWIERLLFFYKPPYIRSPMGVEHSGEGIVVRC